MYGIIYKATNLQNGKVYVGQTIRSLKERVDQHLYEAKTCQFYLHRAIRKYGEAAFTWEQIDTAETPEELDQKEMYWIAFYESFTDPNKGYNSDSGGKSGRPSEDVKRRIGEAQKGKRKNITPEGLERKRQAAANRVWSQASRDKLSESCKGRRISEERKQHLREALTGRPKNSTKYREMWTEEKRQQWSERNLGEGNPNYGKHLSEEAKRSISEKAKARGPHIQSEEERKKRSETMKRIHAERKALLNKSDTN